MAKKILLGLVGLLLVIVLGVFLWARSVLANDGVRTALAAQISKTLGQPVTIGGVGATIYPRVTVTLNDVAIGATRSIQIRTLRLGADFRALLSRRIEHASVHLSGAHVELPLPPLIVGSSAPSSTSKEASSSPIELISIDEVVLSDVAIVSGGRTLRGEIEVVPQGRGVLVRKVSLSADGGTLTVTGQITDLAGPAGDLSIKAGVLNIDQLLAFANEFSKGVGAAPTASPSTALALPGAMNVTVMIDADRATIGTLSIEHVTGRASAKDAAVSVTPLAFDLFGGRYEGTLDVTLGADAPTFRWKATVSNIDVATAVAFAGSPNTVSGRLAAKIDLTGKGVDASAAMKTVRGTARLDVTDGIVKNLGLVRSVGAATALTLAGVQRAAAGARETDEPFSHLGATIVLANGTASSSDLQFDAADLALSANGTMRLDASRLDLKGRLQLSEALSTQVNQQMFRLAQNNGRVVLPATITGPVSAPTVRVDTADMAKRALRNTAKEQANDLIKRGLGGLIKK